jgi:hypothetical protein
VGTETTDRLLSTSSLAYLFASRFVVAAEPGTQGMKSFATGVTVNTRALAVNLPVLALWSLRNSGHISLRIDDEKKNSKDVRAVLIHTGVSSGIEGRFLDQLARNKKAADAGASVGGLVSGLIPHTSLPFEAVIELVLVDVAEKGYVTKVAQGRGMADRLRHKAKWTYEANQQRYPPLLDSVTALAPEWNAFDDELYKSLRDVSRVAIERQRKRLDADYDDFVDGVVEGLNSD